MGGRLWFHTVPEQKLYCHSRGNRCVRIQGNEGYGSDNWSSLTGFFFVWFPQLQQWRIKVGCSKETFRCKELIRRNGTSVEERRDGFHAWCPKWILGKKSICTQAETSIAKSFISAFTTWCGRYPRLRCAHDSFTILCGASTSGRSVNINVWDNVFNKITGPWKRWFQPSWKYPVSGMIYNPNRSIDS